MTERVTNVLTVVAVACAVAITALVVRSQLLPQDAGPYRQGTRVQDWEAVADGAVWSGSAVSHITMVEFLDFQCPACRRLAATLDTVLTAHGEGIRVVHRNFPLKDMHPRAYELALGALCAARYGRFAEYYQRAFEMQTALAEPVHHLPVEALVPQVSRDSMRRCLADPATAASVDEDIALGMRLGIHMTPTLVINGRMYAGAWSARQLDSLLAGTR